MGREGQASAHGFAASALLGELEHNSCLLIEPERERRADGDGAAARKSRQTFALAPAPVGFPQVAHNRRDRHGHGRVGRGHRVRAARLGAAALVVGRGDRAAVVPCLERRIGRRGGTGDVRAVDAPLVGEVADGVVEERLRIVFCPRSLRAREHGAWRGGSTDCGRACTGGSLEQRHPVGSGAGRAARTQVGAATVVEVGEADCPVGGPVDPARRVVDRHAFRFGDGCAGRLQVTAAATAAPVETDERDLVEEVVVGPEHPVRVRRLRESAQQSERHSQSGHEGAPAGLLLRRHRRR